MTMSALPFRFAVLLLALCVAGCYPDPPAPPDADGDGVVTAEDCDDDDAQLGALADDGDCDGALTGADCDEAD